MVVVHGEDIWLFSIRRGAVFSGDPPIGIHH
jgi:hypothetical protein